ncbi:hypothetical protein E2C01_061775 [Portunus trituberculatus]|uniref:Uncharacterized protein n=1 Tax=Portunus trituberculatus TaxID=210409 RepID=A0A5B7HFB8_PORTR|nr:hypothetical protein [Portunus trituberculatus]
MVRGCEQPAPLTALPALPPAAEAAWSLWVMPCLTPHTGAAQKWALMWSVV